MTVVCGIVNNFDIDRVGGVGLGWDRGMAFGETWEVGPPVDLGI